MEYAAANYMEASGRLTEVPSGYTWPARRVAVAALGGAQYCNLEASAARPPVPLERSFDDSIREEADRYNVAKWQGEW